MEIVTLIGGVAAAYFAGITALANITTAYQEYRKNHPKVKKTDPRIDYVKQHDGQDIKLPQEPVEFYKGYTYLLPEILRGPKPSRFHYILPEELMVSINRLSAKIPDKLKLDSFRSSSSRSLRNAKLLGGDLKLTQPQNAEDTYKDNFVGLNTGKQPMYTLTKAEKHWATVASGSICDNDAAQTIAVLNWTTQVVTVFVKNAERVKGMFFRNYQVHNCNIKLFAEEFQNQVVFTGIVKQQSLVGTSASIILVEEDRECSLKSTNSWQKLGLPGDVGNEFMFVAMMRAALFGLIECLYDDPTSVNVDMREGFGSEWEFVHADVTEKGTQSEKDGSIFSVFAFSSSCREYAKQVVLVG